MSKSIIASLVLLSCPLFAGTPAKANAKQETQCPQGVTSIIDIRHRESGGVGYSQGYTSLDYFLTAQWTSWELLFDLRGHLFNDNKGAGNVGLGARFPISNEKYLIGANLFYDCRQSSHLFTNQLGAGLEWLGRDFDFRLNGYLPIGQQKHLETKVPQGFTGNNLTVISHFKGALPSIEGEVGVPCNKYLYLAAGPYYLFQQEKSGIRLGNALGGKFRGEVNLGRYFSLEAVVTTDHIFHTRLQGVVSLNIPLGKWRSMNKGKRCLRQVPIMRNEIIPLQTKRKSGVLTTGSSNDPIQFFFVDNTAAPFGNGSIERPFASLKEAEVNSKPGSVIYVFPGDKTPKNMNEGIVLKEKQVIASSGAPLVIEGVKVPAITPGQSPVITNIHSDQPVIGNPGNSDLSDFVILNPWDYIFGNWGFEPSTHNEIDNGNAPAGQDIDLEDFAVIPRSPSASDGFHFVN